MPIIEKQLERLRTSYLSVWTVLLMDICLSFMSSLVVMAGVNILAESTIYSRGWFAVMWLVSSLLSSVVAFLLLRTYTLIIRYTRFVDTGRFALAMLLKALVMFVTLKIFDKDTVASYYMILLDLVFSCILLIGVRLLLIRLYDYYKSRVRTIQTRKRILIYGTGDKSVAIVTRLSSSPHYEVVGFVAEGVSKRHSLMGQAVHHFASEQAFASSVRMMSLSAVLFVKGDDVRAEKDGIIKYCISQNVQVLIAPAIDDASNIQPASFRALKIEDLLGREEIQISMDDIHSAFSGKVVLVTGAAGSIGSEICRQLAPLGVEKLILFDSAETPVHNLRLELEDRFKSLSFVPVIGDVRARHRLDYVFRRWHPQIVFHAAAYKHVPLMEENPCEAVMVNLCGSRNVAEKALEYGAEEMVMISTDKAVNPTNVMGMTKRLAEMYVQSLGLALEEGRVKGSTRFVTTRFGNVLGSNGSVIPRFTAQIAAGGPVTVTHPEITRYFMTIPEACRLVMEAAILPEKNRIFVFDMGMPVKIVDLARKMIELSGYVPDKDIKIVFSGLRPGEKLYEEVLSSAENTDPTRHDRIRMARVRPSDYEDMCKAADEFFRLASEVDIEGAVRLAMKLVPEWKTTNPEYLKYD